MSVLVAIPVHERATLVRWCLASAVTLRVPAGSGVLILDDCSQTLSASALATEAGLVATHVRLSFRIGADAMIWLIWQQFLASPHDHLLMLDSDLVANAGALELGLAALESFAGLLSLYNSVRHAPIGAAPGLVHKRMLGNAGTLWTRDLVGRVSGGVAPGSWLDMRYSDYLHGAGVPLASLAASQVQHLGHEGSNNRWYGGLEHGAGYVPDGPVQSAAIVAAYDDLMSRQAHYRRPMPEQSP